jgi:phytoene dehydrogenase-like protein
MVVLKLKDGQEVDTSDSETMQRIALVQEMDRPPITAMEVAEAQEEHRQARKAQAEAGTAEGTTGAAPMIRVSDDPPPPPLVGDFMATFEDTVIYGRGGSTKGTTAAWLALQNVQKDSQAVVYIADFEHHPEEWSGRLRRLGATDEDLARIYYASPFSGDWTYPRGSLPQVAEYIRQDCERLGATLLIVDSMSAAMGKGEAMGGWSDAGEYFDALRVIRGSRRLRTLNLAHVAGNSEKFPDRPFGSVQIHNAARETWAIAVNEEQSEGADAQGLNSTEAELRCKKASGRQKPRPNVITYTYEPNYGPITVKLAERRSSNGDLVYGVLIRTPDQLLTAKQIAAAIKSDTGEARTEAQITDAIRTARFGRFDTDAKRRPFRFKIAAGDDGGEG